MKLNKAKMFAMLALALMSVSCWNNLNEIKDIPKIEYAKHKNIDRQSLAYHFGYQKGFNSQLIETPANIEILMLDNKFKVIDYFWFRKFNNWFKKMKFQAGIMAIDSSENLDCDNYAMIYKSMSSIASYKSGEKVEPAIALIIVEQKNAFGGVPAGGLHMLNLIFASNGWYVFEPQTGEWCNFDKYPNQKTIRTIIL